MTLILVACIILDIVFLSVKINNIIKKWQIMVGVKFKSAISIIWPNMFEYKIYLKKIFRWIYLMLCEEFGFDHRI